MAPTLGWGAATAAAAVLLLWTMAGPAPAAADKRGISVEGASAAGDQKETEPRGLALVFGNSRYRHISPLPNPANDAADVAAALEHLGFDVTLAVDASHQTMENAILGFGRKLRKGGVGLFYFAGHGVQVAGRNYLIPVDANVDSESDVRFEAVDAGRVLGKMEDAGNGVNIIILDACRNNPFVSKFRSDSRGLAKMEAPTGSILAYSTAPGAVAADGDGRNGLYTAKFLHYIRQEGLSIEDCFKKVRVEVMAESGQKQVPWESSSLTANFYFLEPKSVKVETREPVASDTVDKSADILFWESVKDSKDVVQYQFYIDEFPDGTFAALAKLYIRKYAKKESPAPQKSEPKADRTAAPNPAAQSAVPSAAEPQLIQAQATPVSSAPVAASGQAAPPPPAPARPRPVAAVEPPAAPEPSGSAGKDGAAEPTVLAAAQPSAEPKPAAALPPGGTVRMAFLPSHLVGIFRNFGGPSAEQLYLRAVHVIKKHKKVHLVYAYKDDPKVDAGRVWKKGGFLSPPAPDTDGIQQYCRAVGADIALAIRMIDTGDGARIDYYLVDAQSGAVVSHEKSGLSYQTWKQRFGKKIHKTIVRYFEAQKSSTAPAETKSIQASTLPAPTNAGAAVRVVFLPSLIRAAHYSSSDQLYLRAIDAVKSTEYVHLVHAYQDDPKTATDRIWKKSGLLSSPTIDADGIVQYCTGMNADIGLAIRIYDKGSFDYTIVSYLVEVKTGKVITREEKSLFKSEQQVLKEVIRRSIGQYLAARH